MVIRITHLLIGSAGGQARVGTHYLRHPTTVLRSLSSWDLQSVLWDTTQPSGSSVVRSSPAFAARTASARLTSILRTQPPHPGRPRPQSACHSSSQPAHDYLRPQSPEVHLAILRFGCVRVILRGSMS